MTGEMKLTLAGSTVIAAKSRVTDAEKTLAGTMATVAGSRGDMSAMQQLNRTAVMDTERQDMVGQMSAIAAETAMPWAESSKASLSEMEAMVAESKGMRSETKLAAAMAAETQAMPGEKVSMPPATTATPAASKATVGAGKMKGLAIVTLVRETTLGEGTMTIGQPQVVVADMSPLPGATMLAVIRIAAMTGSIKALADKIRTMVEVTMAMEAESKGAEGIKALVAVATRGMVHKAAMTAPGTVEEHDWPQGIDRARGRSSNHILLQAGGEHDRAWRLGTFSMG